MSVSVDGSSDGDSFDDNSFQSPTFIPFLLPSSTPTNFETPEQIAPKTPKLLPLTLINPSTMSVSDDSDQSFHQQMPYFVPPLNAFSNLPIGSKNNDIHTTTEQVAHNPHLQQQYVEILHPRQDTSIKSRVLQSAPQFRTQMSVKSRTQLPRSSQQQQSTNSASYQPQQHYYAQPAVQSYQQPLSEPAMHENQMFQSQSHYTQQTYDHNHNASLFQDPSAPIQSYQSSSFRFAPPQQYQHPSADGYTGTAYLNISPLTSTDESYGSHSSRGGSVSQSQQECVISPDYYHQNHETPHELVRQYVYKVQFKRRSQDFLAHSALQVDVQNIMNRLVIVCVSDSEGAWGEDLGRVVQAGDPTHVTSSLPFIIRTATDYECFLEWRQRVDEEQVLQYCRQMAHEIYRLPIRIVDAEYQFDRNKLTVYYALGGDGPARVDFRDFVKAIYSTFKARIWMVRWFEN